MDRGKKPERFLQLLENPQPFDQQTYAENKGRDLERVFNDFQGVRLQLEEWLETLTPRQLFDKGHFQKWLGKRTLADLIAAATYLADERFIPSLEMFAAGWQAREARKGAEELGIDN
jgi:hypothetical protein